MYNKNAAYDFQVIEERRRKRTKKNVVKLPSAKARRLEKLRAKKMTLFSVFASTVLLAGVVSFFVMGQVQLTELTDRAAKASKVLKESESVNTQLSMRFKSSKVQAVQKTLNEHIPVEIVKVSRGDAAEIS